MPVGKTIHQGNEYLLQPDLGCGRKRGAHHCISARSALFLLARTNSGVGCAEHSVNEGRIIPQLIRPNPLFAFEAADGLRYILHPLLPTLLERRPQNEAQDVRGYRNNVNDAPRQRVDAVFRSGLGRLIVAVEDRAQSALALIVSGGRHSPLESWPTRNDAQSSLGTLCGTSRSQG